MSAELEQRQRIISFCLHHGITEPNFSSSADLSRALAAALNVLDSGGNYDASMSNLTSRRDLLRADLNAHIAEVAGMEQDLSDTMTTFTTVKALELIAQIELIAHGALVHSGD